MKNRNDSPAPEGCTRRLVRGVRGCWDAAIRFFENFSDGERRLWEGGSQWGLFWGPLPELQKKNSHGGGESKGEAGGAIVVGECSRESENSGGVGEASRGTVSPLIRGFIFAVGDEATEHSSRNSDREEKPDVIIELSVICRGRCVEERDQDSSVGENEDSAGAHNFIANNPAQATQPAPQTDEN